LTDMSKENAKTVRVTLVKSVHGQLHGTAPPRAVSACAA